MAEILYRPITLADVQTTRQMRLDALRDHLEAFGSDYNDLLAAPANYWHDRVAASFEGKTARVIVAESNGELAGMAGVIQDQGAKVDHQAFIWGVYVRPAFRGRRVVDGMMRALIDWCGERKLRKVRLSATTSNSAAIQAYQRVGFNVYGIEQEVIRVGYVYHDEVLMWRRI